MRACLLVCLTVLLVICVSRDVRWGEVLGGWERYVEGRGVERFNIDVNVKLFLKVGGED